MKIIPPTTGEDPLRGGPSMRKEKGAAAVELALFAPFLILLTMAGAEFGWMTANSVMVMNAASSGARYLASQRGTLTPYTDTNTQIKASASLLAASSLTVQTVVDNVACNANDTCARSLTDAVKNGAVTNARVTVNYTYRSLTGLANAFLPQSLSASSSARVL
jgi:Flp pilus assembly protein TadG